MFEKSTLKSLGEKGTSRKTRVKITPRQRYDDEAYWNKLALEYLGSYALPRWNKEVTATILLLWMERIGVNKTRFQQIFGVSPTEFCAINSKWPLRAVIGLLLEIRYNDRVKPAIG